MPKRSAGLGERFGCELIPGPLTSGADRRRVRDRGFGGSLRGTDSNPASTVSVFNSDYHLP